MGADDSHGSVLDQGNDGPAKPSFLAGSMHKLEGLAAQERTTAEETPKMGARKLSKVLNAAMDVARRNIAGPQFI